MTLSPNHRAPLDRNRWVGCIVKPHSEGRAEAGARAATGAPAASFPRGVVPGGAALFPPAGADAAFAPVFGQKAASLLESAPVVSEITTSL